MQEEIRTDTLSPSESIDKPESLLTELFDSIGQYLIGIGFAYLLGYWGLHFSWALIVVYAFYKIQKKRELRKKRILTKNLESRRKKQELKESVKEEKEKAEWLNTMVAKAWITLNPYVQQTAKEKVREAVEVNLRNSKPPLVESIVLGELDLGKSAPEILGMKTYYNLPESTYKLDFDFSYLGDMHAVIDVILGGKFLNVKLPIAIRDITIKGRIHIRAELWEKPPFIQKLNLAFSNLGVDLTIKPLKAFDLLDLPMLHDWVCNTIVYTLKNTPIVIDLSGTEVESPQQEQEGCPRPSLCNYKEDTNGKKGKKKMERQRFGSSNKLKASQKAKETIGLLTLKVMEAKNLFGADKTGYSDPFVVMKIGDEYTLKTAIIKQELNPKWNEEFKVEIFKDLEKLINITVFDHNVVGNNKFIGACSLEFSDMKDEERKDVWIPLVTESGNLSGNLGEIHIELFYENR